MNAVISLVLHGCVMSLLPIICTSEMFDLVDDIFLSHVDYSTLHAVINERRPTEMPIHKRRSGSDS